MKVLELFAGTRSIGKAFEKRGHEVFSVEWNKDLPNIDLYADISKLTAQEIIDKFGYPDVIWASPDCTTFSVAGISHHRRQAENGDLIPISEYAKFCDECDKHVIELIKELNPTYYFIENPRGGMRKMSWIQELPRYTITYCQYGDTRMKPTDIWTNHPDPKFKPACKNGDKCHVSAPRGSATGTQGIKGAKDRSVIPEALCEHIVDICEEWVEPDRICTCCGKPMPDGYVIGDGLEYYCSDDCLHSAYTKEEYEELCAEDNAYYTTFECTSAWKNVTIDDLLEMLK